MISLAGGFDMSVACLQKKINIFLFFALAVNISFWAGSRTLYAEWAGVPPVPTRNGALSMSLGDSEFSYRTGAAMLQTLGDGGGRVTSLLKYDYKQLEQWFVLLYRLDPASEVLPLLVAHYFGSVRDPESVKVVVDFLEVAGQNPAGEKWRWLGEAAFLARYRLDDLDRALEISYKLSHMKPLDKPLPAWAREFPAFILAAQGDKAKARDILLNVVRTEKKLPWQEMNFIVDALVNRLDMPQEEAQALYDEWETNNP